MEKYLKILAAVVCAALLAGAAWAAPKAMTDLEKRSYAIGANVGRNLKQQGVGVDPALIAKGLVEEMDGKSLLSDAEVAALMQQFKDEVQLKQVADRRKSTTENKQRGEAFLAENAKKDGVKTLRGGRQYRVLQAGTGDKPTDDSIVMCNYRGTLVDGKEFDASPPGKPASFRVSKVIPGWREALKQMPVGSKWELVIPAGMAYGERGAAPAIGPNETLVFEVELVGIKD